MQLSYDYAKDRALMCLGANYESHPRTATADDRFCCTCGDPLSAPTAEYGKVTEDSAGARWQATHWTVTRRYCRRCGRQQSSQPDGVLPGEHYGTGIMSKVATLRHYVLLI